MAPPAAHSRELIPHREAVITQPSQSSQAHKREIPREALVVSHRDYHMPTTGMHSKLLL
jgi:hypothetical protein